MAAERILVAEDDLVIAKVLRLTLQRAGFEVTVAENGRIAADLLAESDFDFLITDYQMPEMNGGELCRTLRKSERNRDIPIVLCSAKGNESHAYGLDEELSLQRVVPKPFSPREMAAIVRSVFEEESLAV